MKATTRFSIARMMTAIVVCAGLLVASPALAIGKPHNGFARLKNDPAAAPVAKAKTVSSRNNDAVKIYPDIIKRSMHVIARDNAKKEIDFFVFDLQGTLVQNVRMKEKDHLKIAGLARGKYIYRVFSGDEETASGQFEIR